MNIVVFLLFIIIVGQTLSASKNATDSRQQISKHPLVDALIVRLQQETWAEDEQECLRNTFRILHGVRNNTLWATWIWDSMQPPVGALYATHYHIGNYNQCLNTPWEHIHTQYCLVDIEGTTHPHMQRDSYQHTELYLNTLTKHGRSLNQMTIGVCLPSSCSMHSIVKIYKHIHYFTYLADGNITINSRDCQKSGEIEPKTTRFYVFWGTLALIFLTVATSTWYCNFTEGKNKFMESLDVVKNWEDLFKENSSDIKVMNGIRFLAASSLVGSHVGLLTNLIPVVNTLDLDETVNSVMGTVLMHTDVIVDTFFVMSGVLLAKGLLMKKNNLLLSLVKRYVRLIGPLALATFYVTCSVYHGGSGPFWKRSVSQEADYCEVYWWKNFLMINNDVGTHCYSVTWYVSCDYQLAVLGTLMFFIYRLSRRMGILTFVTLGVALTFKLGFDVYTLNAPLIPFKDTLMFFNLRNEKVLNYIYYNIETHAAVYFIGIAMGYILTVYKPTDFKNVIGKTTSGLLCAVSMVMMSLVVSLYYLCKECDARVVAITAALNRSVWALAVCGLIAVAEYGTPNLLTNLLSARIFTPLAKLSYGVYMMHPILAQRYYFAKRSVSTFDLMSMVINSCGIVLISIAISLVIYLIIEKPLIIMANKIVTGKDKALETQSKEEIQKNSRQQNEKSKIL